MVNRRITISSRAVLPNIYQEKYQKIIKMMVRSIERYSEDYLNRLCLDSWVDVIEGTVTSIDR